MRDGHLQGPLPCLRRLAATLSLLILAWLPACGGDGGADPVQPPEPDPPTVTAVTPSAASPGTEVTVTGTGFGSSDAPRSVTFRGFGAATVTWVSASTLRAVVPTLSPGEAPVVVTVSGRASGPASFEARAEPPVVVSLDPESPRAGGLVVIQGTNLPAGVGTAGSASAGAVSAGGPARVIANQNGPGGVRVLVDGDAIEVVSVGAEGVIARIPLHLAHGSHELTAEVDGAAGMPFSFTSRIFDPSGVWLLPVEIVENGCPVGPPEGARFVLPASFSLLSDDPPQVGIELNGAALTGGGPVGGPSGLHTIYDGSSLRNGQFTFSMAVMDRDPQPEDPLTDVIDRVLMNHLVRITDVVPGFGECEIVAEGERGAPISEEPSALRVAVFDFTALGTGSGAPAATTVPLLDPFSFAPVGTLPLGFDGFWLRIAPTGTFPHHVGSFTGTIRVLQGDATFSPFACPACAPVGGRLLPWFTSQAGHVIAFDAPGLELDREPVGLVDNQAATGSMGDFLKIADNSGAVPADRISYTYDYFSYVPDGSGFSRLAGGAIWVGSDREPLRSERFNDALDRFFSDGHNTLGLRPPSPPQ